MESNNLISQCGIFCGACRTNLMQKKDLLEAIGFKIGCKRCLPRDKDCAFAYMKRKKKMVKMSYKEPLERIIGQIKPVEKVDLLDDIKTHEEKIL